MTFFRNHNKSIHYTISIFLILVLMLTYLLLHKFAYNNEKTKLLFSANEMINKVVNTKAAEYNVLLSDTTKHITSEDFIKNNLIPAIHNQVSTSLGLTDETIVITTDNSENILASYNVKSNDSWAEKSVVLDFHLFSDKKNPNYTCFFHINNIKAEVLSRLKWPIAFIILLLGFFVAIFIFMIKRWKSGHNASKLKDEFFQNVTHELKTPIATTAIATDIFKKFEYSLSPKKTKTYIEIIVEENRKMKQIVDRLLSISIVDDSNSKMIKNDVNIHSILHRTVKGFEFVVSERGGIIEEELLASKSIIWGDESFVTMIFTNLIDNAIKYSIEAPILKISTQSDLKGIYIHILDHGIGIPADDIQKVFIKTFRVKGNHDVKGFGLGLYFVKQLVESHDGYIDVKSELNKGTEFTVFLPFKNDK